MTDHLELNIPYPARHNAGTVTLIHKVKNPLLTRVYAGIYTNPEGLEYIERYDEHGNAGWHHSQERHFTPPPPPKRRMIDLDEAVAMLDTKFAVYTRWLADQCRNRAEGIQEAQNILQALTTTKIP